MRLITALFVALAAITSPLRADTAPVTIFAAASLRGALDTLAQSFDAKVQLSYGGSGTMARQVAQGAPADAVILANATWMDWLETHAKMQPGSRQVIATNALVLIAPAGGPATGAGLAVLLGKDGRLAMGQRDAVPAGIYAREWLQSTGQWDAIKNRLAETDNVRAALALVARGQSPVGVVYASDAMTDPDVQVLAQIPADTHSAIVYPAAAFTPAGAAFLNHLTTPASQAIFATHGFIPVSK
jgi:molybdate transport system substrate-binding protein